jgi:hypothetical protein
MHEEPTQAWAGAAWRDECATAVAASRDRGRGDRGGLRLRRIGPGAPTVPPPERPAPVPEVGLFGTASGTRTGVVSALGAAPTDCMKGNFVGLAGPTEGTGGRDRSWTTS